MSDVKKEIQEIIELKKHSENDNIYYKEIIKNGKEHPTVVISNIFDSMNHILNVYDYNGKYAEDKGKTYR